MIQYAMIFIIYLIIIYFFALYVYKNMINDDDYIIDEELDGKFYGY